MLLKFIFPEMEENGKHILMPFHLSLISHMYPIACWGSCISFFPLYEIDGLRMEAGVLTLWAQCANYLSYLPEAVLSQWPWE